MDNNNIDETLSENNSLSEEKKTFSVKKLLLELAFYLVLIFVCIYIVPTYIVQRTVVDGPSMENTLYDEESLIVEKVSYRFVDPDRFDIVVFYPYGREDKENYYVKRIIGLPGEKVQIIGSDIYINDEKLEENFGKDPITDPGIASEPIVLGEDQFFVLGDNREVSEDSRMFGPVDSINLEGQVVLRIFPFDRFGLMTDK